MIRTMTAAVVIVTVLAFQPPPMFPESLLTTVENVRIARTVSYNVAVDAAKPVVEHRRGVLREGVLVWEPLVATYFESSDVHRALAIIQCESGGNPDAKNPHSTASGLFQILGSSWGYRSERAGVSGSSIFDPVANVIVAAWLVYEYGGWGHWNASRPCWSRL